MWLKGIRFNVIDSFGPNHTVATKDSEYRLFLGSSSSFCSLITDRFPFVFLLTSDMGFIHFNGTREDLGNVSRHNKSNLR